MRSASASASSIDRAMPPSGCGIPTASTRLAKRMRSSAWSIVSRLAPSNGIPAVPIGLFSFHDRADALGIERLEVQARAGVEVRGYRLRVRVDHDRLPALFPQLRGGLGRAIG